MKLMDRVFSVVMFCLACTVVYASPAVLYNSGNVEIGTDAEPLKVAITSCTVSSLGDGPVGIGSTAPRAALDVDGAIYGTRFVSTVIMDTGTNIGIGSSVPQKKLDVVGTVKATAFSGTLTGDVTGNVTGNASGTSATVTEAAQTAITSVGTLSALKVSGAINWQDATLTGTNINWQDVTMVGTATIAANVTGALTGNADTVTTNANLTGPVTSSGNATSIASNGIQGLGINWSSVTGGGINWEDVTGL